MISNSDIRIYYTWQDIEYKLLSNKCNWPDALIKVEVYSEQLLLYIKEQSGEDEILNYLKNMFGKYYDSEKKSIRIEATLTELQIYFEYPEEYLRRTQKLAPLFKDYMYVKKNTEQIEKELPGAKVVAFHSYKGGVGRTLSVIATTKEIIEKYRDNKKLLLVDADIEAPGLTWLSQQENMDADISYLDILSIIQSSGYDETTIENISHIVEKSVLNFNTNTMIGSHYFLPTYRFKEQILNVYSNPERIMKGTENKYIIVDFLSKLGEKLNVDTVIVDLRAGISEYSAPFLFDVRVNKFLVTSTSYQSVYGTKMMLEQMMKLNHNENSNILLTKVPYNDFSDETREKIYDSLLAFAQKDNENADVIQNENEDSLNLTDFILEIPMSDILIHLGDLNDICNKLKQAEGVTNKIKDIINIIYPQDAEKIIETSENNIRKEFLHNLHDLANDELTAEGAGASKMLTTKALEALGRDFKREIPQIVILGVKGSGKTYLYKQMLYAKTWSKFLECIGQEARFEEEVLIYPLLSTMNRKKMNVAINECIGYCASKFDDKMESVNKQSQIIRDIRNIVESDADENQWSEFWVGVILKIFKNSFENLFDIDKYLAENNKKVIFIIDGLEDIFDMFGTNKSQKLAIKSLCTDFMNALLDLSYGNIGVVTFLRKDIAEIAIKTNVEQFKNQYNKYELTWTQKEALRLALWLANNACNNNKEKIYDNSIIPIKNAPPEAIEEALYKLWGKKMGPESSKTAYSSRWVLASLSDFNGQLQARDIVRFLKFASEPNVINEKKIDNRYLSVIKMKEAVKKCSEQKLNEITAEIKQLEPIFKKLSEKVESEKKIVPLKEEVIEILTNEEQDTLKRYGYFLKSGDEYYIPECIRYALDYNKTKRGGNKIVSLLVQK